MIFLKWGGRNKKGGLADWFDFLKWGVLNKKYFAEKKAKKLPPTNIRPRKVIDSKFAHKVRPKLKDIYFR